jgi:tRNA-Thr(GGU) m(6)t(6)A37 methyltransferase TsaA
MSLLGHGEVTEAYEIPSSGRQIMDSPSITYTPVGIIHSPFHDPAGMPIQPPGARGIRGTVEVFPPYREGLMDLEGFSRVILIYHFHRCRPGPLTVRPYLDNTDHGVFATRAPARPNPIGISIVRLISVRDGILTVEDLDILDGTPLLDVKPYVPAFDAYPDGAAGWLDGAKESIASARSDGRFHRLGP